MIKEMKNNVKIQFCVVVECINKREEVKKAHQDFFEGRILHQTTSAWNKDGKEISVDLRASFIQHKGKKALLFSLSEREV